MKSKAAMINEMTNVLENFTMFPEEEDDKFEEIE
jgi:hypothetical protein